MWLGMDVAPFVQAILLLLHFQRIFCVPTNAVTKRVISSRVRGLMSVQGWGRMRGGGPDSGEGYKRS